MNMQSHRIELYGHIIDIPAPRVFANLIHGVFNPIEKNWHNKIVGDFYDIFENLDDVYENSGKIAQDVLSQSINAALGILAEYSIYDVDAQKFIECYLIKYDVWDKDFESIASQYESIMQETAHKDAYRTQRRLSRSKLVGFGPAPSAENGYRSPQQYANFSNTVDNIGHGIFNMMAKGVTAIGNSIKKDEIFKSQKTVKSFDSAVRSIIFASKEAVIDALNERYDGAIHHHTKEEMQKASAIITSVENGRIPESDVKKEILGLMAIYPYDERIYTHLLTRFGADAGKLDAVAEYFGISNLEDEKEKIFRSKLDGANISSVDEIQASKNLFRDFASNIGYSGYEKNLEELLDVVREKEFQMEVAKYQLRTLLEWNQNLPILENYAKSINYKNFTKWASNMQNKLETTQERQAVKQQEQKEADEFEKQSMYTQLMTSNEPSIKLMRAVISLVLILLIYLLYKWNP